MKNQKLMQKIINRLGTAPGLILLHHNADIDALGSALALRYAYPSYSIGVFQNISQIGKKFLRYFDDVTILDNPELGEFKNLVILDTSTPSQLGIQIDDFKEYIVIDHHTPSESWNTELYYCDDSKTSCAEIILELLEFINFQISPKVALAMVIAIIVDTGHFKYATSETFLNFAKLLELADLTTGEIFNILEESGSVDKSQRIAQLKGAQRLRFEQANGYLIASSKLSSYEAAMCKHLIMLGADVAFVGAQRDDQVRISGRASRELVNKGLHLGEFFKSLSSELMCEGGGHNGAAGLNGTGDVEMMLNACMSKIYEILRKF